MLITIENYEDAQETFDNAEGTCKSSIMLYVTKHIYVYM